MAAGAVRGAAWGRRKSRWPLHSRTSRRYLVGLRVGVGVRVRIGLGLGLGLALGLGLGLGLGLSLGLGFGLGVVAFGAGARLTVDEAPRAVWVRVAVGTPRLRRVGLGLRLGLEIGVGEGARSASQLVHLAWPIG